MLPVAELDSQALEFPLGLADFEKITGHPFDRVTYSAIPQFTYMGEKDENDAVVHHDAYSDEERALIFKLLGRTMMPDRWKAVEAVYQTQRLPVQFKTYAGIGHGTDGTINGEVAAFYRGMTQVASLIGDFRPPVSAQRAPFPATAGRGRICGSSFRGRRCARRRASGSLAHLLPEPA